MSNKAPLALCLVVSVSMLGCSSAGRTPPMPAAPSPVPSAFVWPAPSGQFVLGYRTTSPTSRLLTNSGEVFLPQQANCRVVNNTWGISTNSIPGNGTGRSAIFEELVNGVPAIGWAWDVKKIQVGPVVYPEIGWGWSPWLMDWHNGPVPTWRISDHKRYAADFNIRRTDRSGMWNTDFDIWLFPVPNPKGGPERFKPGIELMIFLDQNNFGPWKQEISIARGPAGRDWTAWKSNQSADWTLIGYLNNGEPIDDARGFDLTAFFDDAVDRYDIPADDYIIDIEFGSEVYDGHGMLELANYRVGSQ